MGLEKHSKQIGEFTYEVTTLGAKLADRMLLKLGKSVGPVFLAAAGAESLRADSFSALSEDDYDWVVEKLARATDVQMGDKAPSLWSIYDLHFAGKPVEKLEWLRFAVEVNFGPFFLAIMARVAAKKAADTAKTASRSTSPATSAGASNES